MIVEKANSGHGQSCRAGYEMALNLEPDWIFQIDSDGQCDPQFFSRFWQEREQADCVFGERVTRDDGFARRLISLSCRVLLWCFSGSYVKDPNVPYRLIPADFDMQNVALALILKRDHAIRFRFLPIHFRARLSGQSSINFPRIIRMGWTMLLGLRRIR